jgi:glycine oxidase
MEWTQQRGSVGVVGGGIIGMSAAWRLAQAGFAVMVYEKSTVGGEASWAGAGMLAPGGEFEGDSELARLAVESRDLYPAFVDELRRESGLAIDLQETGALEVAYSAEEMRLLDERAERQAAIGIPSKRVSTEQITTFWPLLNKEQLAGGYFYPGDAAVDPRHVMGALRIACEKAGVTVVEPGEVKSITVETAVVCLDTNRHDAVVIAAGAWSGLIAVRGVPALPASQPVRGHLLGYRQPERICNGILRRGHTYLLQRANGLLIVGASVERVGFDRGIDQDAAAKLRSEAALLLPHLGETSPSEVWNGFRPGSDELHIGPWHSARVQLAYGHYRNGILLAPVTAQLLTRSVSASLQKR